MLKELKIEGFKLLKDVQINPHKGFNVITGETGAGKSLILGALKFLFGAPGGDEIFAKGEDSVRVSASIEISPDIKSIKRLIEEGIIDHGEKEIHLERWKERDGKSRIFLGGRRANLPAVKLVQESTVDFLAQHQASRLTERSALDVLDSIGDSKHQQITSDVSDCYAKWLSLKAELEEKETHLAQLNERRDLMEFQLKELTDANLESGELEELTSELQLLSSATELREKAFTATELLSGETEDSANIQDLLAQVIKMMEPLASIDPDWSSRLNEMHQADQIIRDTTRELASKADSIQDDPKRLSQVEARIATIEKLKRKYSRNLDELIELRNKLTEDIEDIHSGDIDLAEIKSNTETALKDWKIAAGKLSTFRKKLAKKVEKEFKQHLLDLELANSRVLFKFNEVAETPPSSRGFDRVELMLSTNPSEDLRPLSIVASGGEATRIALALKALWAEREGVPVLILDEGDIGIGGDTAYKVGEKFKQLAESHQLIIVSHLAQVAAYADMHYRVEKKESRKHAGITVKEIHNHDRIAELARMIGGSRDTESSIALAKNLLKGNHVTKSSVRDR